jgi:anthranilate phosphoribosyltransferase
MTISPYLKTIGRGKQGARDLSRKQAADLMGRVLDGQVSDLEVGAFCIAMRVKGETPQEMAGFLDACQNRITPIPTANGVRTVVLPSYNGSRKLPLLTPLLALLLAQKGFAVLVHGAKTEASRVTTPELLTALGHATSSQVSEPLQAGKVRYVPLDGLSAGLQKLLMARKLIGLRNSGHSLVKLLAPVTGPSLLVSSYTHPEYLHSMTQTLLLTGQDCLLLRGTEGEAVADPRRMPRMDVVIKGEVQTLQEAQAGSLLTLPDLPDDAGPATVARYTQDVLAGTRPLPAPMARQIELVTHWSQHANS